MFVSNIILEVKNSELRLSFSSCTINFRVILRTAWSAKQVLFNLITCTLYGRHDFPLLILGNKSDLMVDKRLQVLCLLSLKFYNLVNNCKQQADGSGFCLVHAYVKDRNH